MLPCPWDFLGKNTGVGCYFLPQRIEILMIAFTRELIIKNWEMWELMLGVVVIAGLFAVRKYLFDKKKK